MSPVKTSASKLLGMVVDVGSGVHLWVQRASACLVRMLRIWMIGD